VAGADVVVTPLGQAREEFASQGTMGLEEQPGERHLRHRHHPL
jgi:hypothetical protein